MSENKKFYWIKLKTNFFDEPEIDYLLEQKNGSDYVVLYQKLCLITANNNGELTRRIGEIVIPYDDRKISDITNFDVEIVAAAMNLYKQIGLIHIQDNGNLAISNYDNIVGNETKWAEKKKIQRGQKKDNVPKVSPEMSSEKKDNVRQEIELDIRDRDKNLEKDLDLEKESRTTYQLITDMFNDTCVSLPRCTRLSEARKKAIKARLNIYKVEDFKKLFEMAEKSDFLKGASKTNWRANFDWLIADTNMAKTLDGNYNNASSKPIDKNNGTGNRKTFSELIAEEGNL